MVAHVFPKMKCYDLKGAPGRIWTGVLQLSGPTLYPSELQGHLLTIQDNPLLRHAEPGAGFLGTLIYLGLTIDTPMWHSTL